MKNIALLTVLVLFLSGVGITALNRPGEKVDEAPVLISRNIDGQATPTSKTASVRMRQTHLKNNTQLKNIQYTKYTPEYGMKCFKAKKLSDGTFTSGVIKKDHKNNQLMCTTPVCGKVRIPTCTQNQIKITKDALCYVPTCVPKSADGNPKDIFIFIPTWKYNDLLKLNTITFKSVKVPYTKQVLNATYKKLFELRSPQGDGVWNGMRFDKATLNNGELTIHLLGQVRFAGDMSGAYFGKEIDAAAFQYNSVQKIRVLLNGNPFDWCADDMSGLPCGGKFWVTSR